MNNIQHIDNVIKSLYDNYNSNMPVDDEGLIISKEQVMEQIEKFEEYKANGVVFLEDVGE